MATCKPPLSAQDSECRKARMDLGWYRRCKVWWWAPSRFSAAKALVPQSATDKLYVAAERCRSLWILFHSARLEGTAAHGVLHFVDEMGWPVDQAFSESRCVFATVINVVPQ